MGTSASGLGPKDKNPLIPPWAEQGDAISVSPSPDGDAGLVDGTDGGDQGNGDGEGGDGDSQEIDNGQIQQEIGGPEHIQPAPKRFSGARRAFGKYASSGGDTSDLRRSLRSYAKKSSGGGKGTSRRLANGIKAGAGLLGMMRGDTVSTGTQSLSLTNLQGLSKDQVIDRIASHLAPNNADEDAVRIALNYALEEALPETEDFEPESFTEDVIQETITCFLTDLIFQDVVTGMGKAWFKAELASKHHKMENELRELIKVVAEQQMDRATNGNPSSITMDNIKQVQIDTITKTVEYWESYND